MAETLASALLDVLEHRGPMSSSGLAIELGRDDDEVEGALIAHGEIFEVVEGLLARWAVRSADSFSEALGLRRSLHAWQVRSLQAWFAHGRSGMISAVTGAGKTEVGLAAIADARVRGLPALIIVPSTDLVLHWRAVLEEAFPGVESGIVTPDGPVEAQSNLLVVHAASLGHGVRFAMGPHALVVVDEVQRLSATDASRLTTAVGTFKERLGLSSSTHWLDNPGLPPILPMFGDEILGCTYQKAIEDGVLAPVSVITTGVGFAKHERDDYTAANQQAASAEEKLRDSGVDLSQGIYLTARKLASNTDAGQASIFAKEYLRADGRRRQVLAGCRAKLSSLNQLYPVVAAASFVQAIAFTNDDTTAIEAQRAAEAAGLRASSMLVNHSPRESVEQFRSKNLDVLTVSTAATGDVDLPDADLGIVLAPARDNDEMRHRLGRVVAPVGDRRPGLILLVYVNGTVEDPAVGDGAGLGVLKDVAASLTDVGIDEAVDLVRRWGHDGASRWNNESAPKGGAILATTDDWSIEEAILDIFDEYGGFPLWNELRDVLPDIEAEEVLQDGMSQVNWIRIGSQLVGAGGRETTRPMRVEALSMLARAMERFGSSEVPGFELSTALGESSMLGELRFARMRAIWSQLGGRLAATQSAQATEHEGVSDQVVGHAMAEQDGSVDDDPAVEALRVAVAARGGKVKHKGGVFAVTGRDRVQRTASLAGVHEATAGPLSGVRILVDITKASPEFFLFDSSRDGRDEEVDAITAAQWQAANGAWHKLKLGGAGSALASQTRIQRTPPETVRPKVLVSQKSASEGSASQRAGEATGRGSDGVEVRLKDLANPVLATFDVRSGEVTLGELPGHRKLTGRTFRNAAVAAATVKSRLAGRTVFSSGYGDWLVVGDDSTSLETLVNQRVRTL